MKNRDFMTWLSDFRGSIADYGYYIDFEKVHRNVEGIKVELNILNSLIGSKNIEAEYEALLEKYPEILKCIPLLLAVRANEIYAIDGDGEFTYEFKKSNQSVEQYKIAAMARFTVSCWVSGHISVRRQSGVTSRSQVHRARQKSMSYSPSSVTSTSAPAAK